MKAGRTLQELAKEVTRQREAAKDYVASTQALAVTVKERVDEDGKGREEIHLSLGGNPPTFPVNRLAHTQLADRLEIPRKYYDRLNEAAPALLSTNINHWFRAKPEQRMVRTLDGRVRAFLSDRYRPLDNVNLVEAVMPALMSFPDLRIESCEVTESRLYLKAVNPRVQGEVRVGDAVQAGLVISNSEVGAGALSIHPMIYRLSCLNGAIMEDGALRKYHAGRSWGGDAGDGAHQINWDKLSDEARAAKDRATWLEVRDLAKAALDEAVFAGVLARAREAAGQPMVAGPTEVVAVAGNVYGWRDPEKLGVLTALIQGADLTRWGLANAVTAASQGVKDYDRATEMERQGGQILELSPASWRTLSEAKKN